MMRRVLLLLSFLPTLLSFSGNNVSVVPTPPLRQPNSWHFAGIVNERLRSWGGTSDYLSHGACVTVPGGVVYLGGAYGNVSAPKVQFVDSASGESRLLPNLPKGLDRFSATYGAGRIFVAGGQNDGIPNRHIYSLQWPQAYRWETVGEIPGAVRMHASMAIQNAPDGPSLFIFGGSETVDSIHESVSMYQGLKYNFSSRQWSETAYSSTWEHDSLQDISTLVRQPVYGACCTAIGNSHIIFVGGQAPASAYRSDVLAYNTITDTWFVLPGDTLLARCGAVLTPDGRSWLYSGGVDSNGHVTDNVSRISVSQNITFGWINWSVIAIYFIATLLFSLYYIGKDRKTDDFFRGGRSIPWWAAGISIYATSISAITFIAIPAKAYITDWTYYPILWTIPLVGFIVIRYYLPYFRQLHASSAYEILERRFNLTTRLLASLLFCSFMLARLALVLFIPSLALSAVTDINIYTCIILVALITITYSALGGIKAVIWSDVLQGSVFIVSMVFAAIFLVRNTTGGLNGYLHMALDANKLRLFDWTMSWSHATWWVVIFGGFASNLVTYTSDQSIVQRYITTSDSKGASRSIMLNGVMCIVASVFFYVIGTGLYTYFKTHPQTLDVTMSQTDTIFPYFIVSQLPAGAAGLLVAAIFAATMSTISSNINSISTALCSDFVQRMHPSVTDRSLLKIGRLLCVLAGMTGLVVAILMATWDISSLLDYFNTILGLLTCALGGLFFLAVFAPRVKGANAICGFLVGEISVFALYYLTEASMFLFGLVGMVVCILVSLALSIFNKV